MKTASIPEGFHTVTPSICVKNGNEAIEFYKRAFNAKERYRLLVPGGESVAHAEITIGDSIVMLSEENPAWNNRSPQTLGGSPVSFVIYVADCDAAFKQAIDEGATVVREISNQFWGDRMGCVADPFGHQWSFLTHVEDVSPEEMDRRFKEMMANGGGC